MESVPGCREDDCKASGSVKGGGFLDQLKDYKLNNKDLPHRVRVCAFSINTDHPAYCHKPPNFGVSQTQGEKQLKKPAK
jgi:hypothetical protein